MRKDILLKEKGVCFQTNTYGNDNPQILEVFCYTEALVLFSNADANIFFSCINNMRENV